MTALIVTVTPNHSLDRTLGLPGLALGAVNRARWARVEPSGKGVNVTRALAIHGHPSLAVLPLGGQEGEHLATLLAAQGVAYRTVRIGGAVRVNVSLAAPGQVTKVNEPGPTLTAEETAELLRVAQDAAARAAWVVGSGSLPPGVPDDWYGTLCHAAHAAGARFALDSSGAALVQGLAAGPDLVKPNAEELADAVGRPLRTLGEVVAAARQLLTAGAGAVLVSLGPDGALLVTRDQTLHAEAPVERPRSAVGAGDALLAGFLSRCGSRGERPGEPGEAALREAVAWGTAAVRAPGTHMRPVTDADRARVRVHPVLDADRLLRQPAPSGRTTPAQT